MSNIAFKYRLYPNELQEELLQNTFGCCRKIWNLMLADRIEYYKVNKQSLNNTPAQYKVSYPFLKEVDSMALDSVKCDLNNAYSKFFRKKSKFPKFKSKHHSKRSYRTNNNKAGTHIRIVENAIRLPKLGFVKAIIHRKPEDSWKLKSATVSQNPDGSYYVSVLFEYERVVTKKVVSIDKVIGLDYKSNGLYVDSNGDCCGMPKYYKRVQKQLARQQRRLSRKQKDSNNRNKQRLKVARIHRHVAYQRQDFLHKTSTAITKLYDYVCVEDLDIRAMSNKGFCNGKATLDNGYCMFLNMLDYKLKNAGGCLIKIDRWYPSSQICNCCGNQNSLVKNLCIRKWTCPVCGSVHDRDVNAAINIKREGLRILTTLVVA